MSQRRVLVVCYYFPPLGGAGVGRPLGLYKYLPSFGYECDVLTVKPVAYRFFDPELLQGVDTTRIYRSGSRDPQRLMHLLGLRTVKASTIERGRSFTDKMFPDPKKGWIRPAVKLGRVLTENRHYDAVISTSPPISTHVVAMKLSHEFHIPWVADFRDFWTLYKAEDWFKDAKLAQRAHKLLEKISDQASEVTVVNPAIAEYLRKGKTIYNGFDSDIAECWAPPGDLDHFSIGILGTLDPLRPVEPLFQVLAAIRERHSDLFRKVRLIQVGPVQIPTWERTVTSFGLQDLIEQHPQTNRTETIQILSRSSVLYLGLADNSPGLLPIRLFDMIASGRPLLICAPKQSVVREIVEHTGNGVAFSNREIEKAADYLSELIAQSQRGQLTISTIPEYAKQYSTERMAEAFSNLLNEIFDETT